MSSLSVPFVSMFSKSRNSCHVFTPSVVSVCTRSQTRNLVRPLCARLVVKKRPYLRVELKVAGGVDNLKTNFFANSMLELVTYQYEEIKKEKSDLEKCDQCIDSENTNSR